MVLLRVNFIIWFVLWGKLCIKDIIYLWGIVIDLFYSFCFEYDEIIYYFFFVCKFLKIVW